MKDITSLKRLSTNEQYIEKNWHHNRPCSCLLKNNNSALTGMIHLWNATSFDDKSEIILALGRKYDTNVSWTGFSFSAGNTPLLPYELLATKQSCAVRFLPLVLKWVVLAQNACKRQFTSSFL